MNILTIRDHSAIAALDQTAVYQPLPIRLELMNEGRTANLKTAWQPTPEELAKINAGEPIIVSILRPASEPSHPPIMLTVGD